ncbi:MAG: DUF2442 domain-containing protein [Pseudomonadota bacterium]|nr:DUF2442 domain-containing protein [Pseudomonadota bacterium]
MNDRAFRRIRSVEARPGYRLAVSWDQGRTGVVDLSDMISRGGVFAELADKQKFARVRIGENSRVVEWPEPEDELGYPIIEVDADALFVKLHEQQETTLAAAMRNVIETARKMGRLTVPKPGASS